MQFWNSMQVSAAKAAAAFLILGMGWLQAEAQNSPYSRYGLGDLVSGQNTVNKAMGGVSQGYSDGQSLNFSNPASYANLQLATLDIGVDGGSKRIRDDQQQTFRSGSGTFSYLQLGMPLKPGGGWGLNFGLTPLSRMNYNITSHDTLPEIGTGVDRLYQGTGGLYQAFIGTGFRIKGFRFGVNAGYLFGSFQTSTQSIYPNDTMKLYSSNVQQDVSMGSFFWNVGTQLHIKLGKNLHMELGASGSSRQELSADRQLLEETFYYSGDPANPLPQNQDTVHYAEQGKGKVIYPQQLRFGLMLHDNEHWMFGADYEMGKWGSYRFFGEEGNLQDNWKLHVGGQYVPDATSPGKGYWSRVAYRGGFYTGKDYISYAGKDLNTFAITFGAGFPLRNYTRNTQYTTINTAFEIGKRGNASNPLSENFFRVSVGLNLSDIWFIKHKFH